MVKMTPIWIVTFLESGIMLKKFKIHKIMNSWNIIWNYNLHRLAMLCSPLTFYIFAIWGNIPTTNQIGWQGIEQGTQDDGIIRLIKHLCMVNDAGI